MPIFNTRPVPYKPKPLQTESWDEFRGGLNSLLNPTEIKQNELSQADNLMLTGLGSPTKRWGTQIYFMAGATGAVRSQGAYYNGSTNEALAITDWGYLTKKSGASYTMITGASWASGYEAIMTQLDNKVYIVSSQRELIRYAGSTLVGFATIAVPTTSAITNLSGASGLGELTAVSYRIASEGKVGETLASTAISLASVQADPLLHRVRVTWTAVSAASGDLTGYVIYGRQPGRETFMARVNNTTTTYDDDGTDDPALTIDPKTADETGGLRAKYIIRYKDRLIYAGINNDPTRVVISGRVPNQEKNHWSYGGAYILVDPDSGDNITGLGISKYVNGGDAIIVFKERSIWILTLGTVTIGNYTLTDPQYQLLTMSHGCVSHKTIAAVEDDLFFLSRRGVYGLGFKQNLVNVIATTEISAKVRNKFEELNPAQWTRASAEYKDFKYVLSYPESGQSNNNKQLVFDRERAAWMGPWTIAGNNLTKYYDSDNKERLTYGSNVTPFIYDLSSDYGSDDNESINTTLKTRKEDFGSWNLFKTIKDVFTRFREVTGEVNVSIFVDDRNGTVQTVKSFTIASSADSGNSGWASFLWGDAQWGDSKASASIGDVSEIFRWANINSTGRSIQIQVTTDGENDKYKLLGVKLTAQNQGKGSIPASERV